MEIFDKLIISQSCEDIRTITDPLAKHVGIKHFGYVKIFPDGTHITLGTNVNWHKCLYTNFFQHAAYHKTLDAYTSGFHLWSQLTDQTTVKIMRDDFNMDHGIALVEKEKDFCEIFSFGTTSENCGIINWYINNLDVLKKYCLFFKEKAKRIINQATQTDRLILPNCQPITFKIPILIPCEINENSTLNFLSEILFDQMHSKNYPKISCLSRQEFICVYWVSNGYKVKQAAKLIKLSPRTVESHVNNAKIKLEAKNIKELIAIFSQETLQLKLNAFKVDQ